MARRRSKPFIPNCVPDDVGRDGVLWNPTRDELLLEWNIAQIRLAHGEIAKIEAEENRAWLQKQTQRLAAIALEIDEFKRKEAMAAEIEAQEKWFRETCERESAQTKALLEAYQGMLDKATLDAKL